MNGKETPTGTFQILATAADLGPLQQAMTGQPGNAVPISARAAVSIAGTALSFTQLAIVAGKASAHGHLAVNLASPIAIDGDVGADNVDGGWLVSVLLGLPRQAQNAAAAWSSQPLGGGAFAAMNGAVTFTLDHVAFAPALVAGSLKGVAQFRPGEIGLQNIDGGLAGGRVTGELAFRRNADGLISHGHIALVEADAATVLQTDKKIIDARLTLKADFDSIGSSPAALVRAAHGSGAIALADAHIAGLDPAAFAAAMRAADQSTTIEACEDSARCKCCARWRPSGRAARQCNDDDHRRQGRSRQCDDAGARSAALALAGGLDLNTGAVDARMTLAAPPPAHALIRTRPELAVALKGPLAAPARTLDVSALTGWLSSARRRTANPAAGIDRSQWTAGCHRPRGSSGLSGCPHNPCGRHRRIRWAGERSVSRSARIGSVADRSAGRRRHRIDNGKQAAVRAAAGPADGSANSGTAA